MNSSRNASVKNNQLKTLLETCLACFGSLPFVLKNVFLSFGIFWIPVLFASFFSLHIIIQDSSSQLGGIIKVFLVVTENCFTIFLVPYFTAKYLQKYQKPFKVFLTEYVTPLTINYIKAFFVILANALFLGIPFLIFIVFSACRDLFNWNICHIAVQNQMIITIIALPFFLPVINKMARFVLLPQTVFFTDNKKGVIKTCLKIGQGSVLSLVLVFLIGLPIVAVTLSYILKSLLIFTNDYLKVLVDVFIFLFLFCFSIFNYSAATHFFFKIKDK